MPMWKKILMGSSGFGAAFGLVFIVGHWVFAWWSNRPPKPKPWNTTAITAKYSTFRVDTNSAYTFSYDLRNNTDNDYSVSDSADVSVAGRTDDGNLLACGNCISFERPFFIPAHEVLEITVTFSNPYPNSTKAVTDTEKDALRVLERAYLIKEYGRLNGFTILDKDAHYKIELPGDWKKSPSPMKP